MKRLVSVFVLAFTMASAAPASAGVRQMIVEIGDRASVSRTGIATVPVTVTCSFQKATEQTSGTVTLTVSQATKSGAVNGSGTADIICDGVTRTYDVTVSPTSGTFRPGNLTVRADADARGTFEEQMCISNAAGDIQCSTWHGTEFLSGSDGPEAVRADRSGGG